MIGSVLWVWEIKSYHVRLINHNFVDTAPHPQPRERKRGGALWRQPQAGWGSFPHKCVTGHDIRLRFIK